MQQGTPAHCGSSARDSLPPWIEGSLPACERERNLYGEQISEGDPSGKMTRQPPRPLPLAWSLWEPLGTGSHSSSPSSPPASATELKSRFLFLQPQESGPGASAALLSPQEMLQDENRQRKSCGRQEVPHCLGGASTWLSHAALWLRCFQALRKPSAEQGLGVNPSYKLQ